jgi:predicted aspartyl protease
MRLLLICLLLLCSVAPANAACEVATLATVPMQPAGGVLVVPVMVNGTAARFLLDTGAERTVVTREAVQRLGLARDEWVATTMSGVGGIERIPNANPRSITLGGIPLRHRSVARDSTLVVATLPPVTPNQPIDGLLGRDFVSAFDLALDMRAPTLTLYDVKGCAGRFLPWTGDYAEVPVQMPMGSAIVVPVQLDGVPLRALLDTGASTSLLVAPGIARLGLTPERLSGSAHQALGVGPRPVEVRPHRFTTLRVGTDVQNAPVLMVAPAHLVPIVDMLLGGDWLAGKSIWISFATHRLFVAP